jgi:ribosomal protein S13
MYKKLVNKIRKKTSKFLQRHQRQRGTVYFFRKRVPSNQLIRTFPQLIKKTTGLGVYYSKLFSEKLGFRSSSSPLLYKKEKIQTFFSIVEAYARNKKMTLQSTLTKQISSSLSFKIKNGFVSGLRYSQFLPSRGQRSKTNARTNKNRRASV